MGNVIIFGLETGIKNFGAHVHGNKGAKLIDMANMDFPVPPGIIVSTDYSLQYSPASTLLDDTVELVMSRLSKIEEVLGYIPLLSVRSGAPVSMPGMMDTVLNVGIHSLDMKYWEEDLGRKTALDCYRRYLQMFGTVCRGIAAHEFDAVLEFAKKFHNCKADSDLPEKALETMGLDYYEIVAKTGKLPITLKEQLKETIRAVWKSWNSPRAVAYRKLNKIPENLGTAVVIQVMVFGNMNDNSCSGVMFTRNPNTGETGPYGDFCINAQGEDVVAGIKETKSIKELFKWNPNVYGQLVHYAYELEHQYKDMQDIEFTVQDSNLFILQTRNGKRSPRASFKIARDFWSEGVITKKEALARLSVVDYIKARTPSISPEFKDVPLITGIPAGGGIVSGVAVFSSDEAVKSTLPCILVRLDTDPKDIEGMAAAVGILTRNGGTTSHAAVVGRAMNKACVVGATDMQVFKDYCTGDGWTVKAGDSISIDGDTGKVWAGQVPLTDSELPGDVKDFIDSLFEGVNILPTGYGKEDSINGRVYIPYSNFGVGSEKEWALAVKDSIDSGIETYVSFEMPLQIEDEIVLGLFGEPKRHVFSHQACEALLDSVELEGKYKVWGSKPVTLENILMGKVSTDLTTDQIISVFGTKKAYDMILKLMGPVKFESGKQEDFFVESVIMYLNKLFKKGI